jgi:transcriptional antiterminator Rof (Rho-off)
VSDAYHPIDCGLHDRLLAIATLRRTVGLRFLDGDGVPVEARDRVVDVFTRDGAEYLRTSEGTEVRLDRLLEVDGVPFGAGP